ncbi:MAG: substrate-binding domain-containing protein [Candidatus Lokiarchaeota archaeon]|nr:substrate-binding domain-containing protein [Candidatus Lokiarchaeota archaeon]
MEKKLKTVIIIGIIGAGVAVGITAGILLSPVPVLRLSTTTSVNDSGLMDVLIPDFEARFGCDIRLSSKGTGAAIADGSNGDADLILVHSYPAELAWIAAGNGSHRACFMYNDFILVGPTSDPAGVFGLTNVTQAFTYMHDNLTATNPFVSRNDSSGTHSKEKSIWNKAPPHKSYSAIITGHPFYLCANSGMGATLTMTWEKDGYTLTDRGTWYAYEDAMPGHAILSEGDADLINPYSFLLVNATKHPNTNQALAEKFVAFCLSAYGLNEIATYIKNGHQLFTPCWNNTAPQYLVCNSTQVDLDFWNAKVKEFGMFSLS